MKLKIKKLAENAVIPKQMSKGAAGLDLTATSVQFNGNLATYGTGLSFEIPEGYVGLIFPRSSVFKAQMSLTNAVGVIDSDYRGEVKAVFRKEEVYGQFYNVGDRICQLVVIPIPQVEIEEVKELTETERAEGGFGSTGIK